MTTRKQPILSQEEKRLRIAEQQGWKLVMYGDGATLRGWVAPGGVYRKSLWRTYFNDEELPDYFNDLPAMMHAQESLPIEVRHTYFKLLGGWFHPNNDGWMCDWKVVSAGAKERAEAYGLTLKLW